MWGQFHVDFMYWTLLFDQYLQSDNIQYIRTNGLTRNYKALLLEGVRLKKG